MGILDDAIREHLELRRRHGADPDELRQVERSVLGAGDADAAPEERPPAPEPPAAEPEAELEPHVEPTLPDPAPTEPEHVEQPTRQFTAAEVAAAERPARPESPAQAGAEARQEPEPGEHDELEDTPEFLQETPEHDRLWFEQKPPKDFDF